MGRSAEHVDAFCHLEGSSDYTQCTVAKWALLKVWAAVSRVGMIDAFWDDSLGVVWIFILFILFFFLFVPPA